MAGGPNLIRRGDAPAPAQTRRGAPAEGQSPGKAALKRSVRGMDFAAGEAALAPKDGGVPMFAGSGGGGGERTRREDAKAEARKGPRDEMSKSDTRDATRSASPQVEEKDVEGPPGKEERGLGEEAHALWKMYSGPLLDMGRDLLPKEQPDGTYRFEDQKDPSVTLTPEAYRRFAESRTAMHDQFDPDMLEMVVSAFPQWVMENCYIMDEERLRGFEAVAPHRLQAIVNEMKRGARPPEGNWAAFADAGKKSRENLDPAITAFKWAMFIQAGCILGFGVSVAATFEIVRGIGTMVWSGIPDVTPGLKDAVASAWEPPKVTLQTAGPRQRWWIKNRYFDDNTIVHRFFNSMYPQAPYPLREKLGMAMRKMS